MTHGAVLQQRRHRVAALRTRRNIRVRRLMLFGIGNVRQTASAFGARGFFVSVGPAAISANLHICVVSVVSRLFLYQRRARCAAKVRV